MRTKFLILTGLLIATAILVHMVGYDLHTPEVDGVAVIKKIPKRIGAWKGKDVVLAQNVYALLQTRAIVHRAYEREQPFEEVFLSIVYYNKTKVDFHAPESCLGGLGIKTQRKPQHAIFQTSEGTKDIALYQLIQTHEGQKTLVYYFYKTGGFMGRSYLGLRLNLVFNKLTGNSTSGSLIRISTPITEAGGSQEARARLLDFIQDLYPYIILAL